MWESYLTGLVVCGGIIMAIGAQNAYVLGLAVRREYHWWSAGLCMSADVVSPWTVSRYQDASRWAAKPSLSAGALSGTGG